MTADSVWRPVPSGPRDHDDAADPIDVQGCAPACVRLPRMAGAAGGEAQEADPVVDQLVTSSADGCTRELVETAATAVGPPEASLARWPRLRDAAGTEVDSSPFDHDAGAGTDGRPHRARHERAGDEGGAGGRGSSPRSRRLAAAPPAVRAFDHGAVQLGPRLAALEGTSMSTSATRSTAPPRGPRLFTGYLTSIGKVPVHQRPPTSTGAVIRWLRSVGRTRSWSAGLGSRGSSGTTWAGRRATAATGGSGEELEVDAATADERRIGHRIRHCGERLVFRAPNCECDPCARPSLVGANLCTHRMCNHCSRLRSR